MRLTVLLLVIICFLGCKSERPVLATLDGPTGADFYLANTPSYNHSPSVGVTILPGPIGNFDVIYSFKKPVMGFSFLHLEALPRKDWWATDLPDISFLTENNRDIVKFKTPQFEVRFTVRPPKEVLRRHPATISFFSNGGVTILSRALIVKGFYETQIDNVSSQDFEYPVHIFRMASPYPVLDGVKIEPIDSAPYFLKEQIFPSLFSSVNADIIKTSAYSLLLDPGFSAKRSKKIIESIDTASKYYKRAFQYDGVPNFAYTVSSYLSGSSSFLSNGFMHGPYVQMKLSSHWSPFQPKWETSFSNHVIFHEIVHLFQNLYPVNRTTIWMEGGAQAMTYAAFHDLNYINYHEYRLKFKNDSHKCKQGIQGNTLELAIGSNRDLNYTCGSALLDLIVRASPGEDIFSIWKKLSKTTDFSDSTVYGDIKAALSDVSVNPDFLHELEQFLSSKVDDPNRAFARLEALISD